MHDKIAIAFAAAWALSVVVVTLGVLHFAYRKDEPRVARFAPDPVFDPALREDEQWSGVETEWHQFIDSFGVREVSR